MASMEYSSPTVSPRKEYSPTKSVEYFSALPHKLLDDPGLTPRDFLVLASILRFARAKSWASMSNTTLAGMGQCSNRTIQTSLTRIEGRGWITRKPCPDAPGSDSGRLIILNWRTHEAPCTPPVKPAAHPPVKPAAHEAIKTLEERKTAPQGSGSPGPERGGKNRSDVAPRYPTHRAQAPLPPDPDLFTAWLSRAPGDPLRLMAEREAAKSRKAQEGQAVSLAWPSSRAISES